MPQPQLVPCPDPNSGHQSHVVGSQAYQECMRALTRRNFSVRGLKLIPTKPVLTPEAQVAYTNRRQRMADLCKSLQQDLRRGWTTPEESTEEFRDAFGYTKDADPVIWSALNHDENAWNLLKASEDSEDIKQLWDEVLKEREKRAQPKGAPELFRIMREHERGLLSEKEVWDRTKQLVVDEIQPEIAAAQDAAVRQAVRATDDVRESYKHADKVAHLVDFAGWRSPAVKSDSPSEHAHAMEDALVGAGQAMRLPDGRFVTPTPPWGTEEGTEDIVSTLVANGFVSRKQDQR